MQILYDQLTLSFPMLQASHFLLDIETTGLIKSSDAIICIGIIYKRSSKDVCSIQWFAETKKEEKQILEAFLGFCSTYQKVYTYSGKNFDIPFIRERLAYHSLPSDTFSQLLFIDMKNILSKLSPARHTLERLLGYQRKASASGKELASLYKAFEKTHLQAYQTIIFAHHLDELHSLIVCYECYHILHQLTDYELVQSAENLDELSLILKSPTPLLTSCWLKYHDTSIEWHPLTNLIYIKLTIHQGTFKKYLKPAKDYYFIKGQNEIIHKSIAQFIPKDLKQKVSPKQCFVTKTGPFIRLYTNSSNHLDIWYNSLDECFCEYQPNTNFILRMLKEVSYLMTLDKPYIKLLSKT